jgi:hypothetical protein
MALEIVWRNPVLFATASQALQRMESVQLELVESVQLERMESVQLELVFEAQPAGTLLVYSGAAKGMVSRWKIALDRSASGSRGTELRPLSVASVPAKDARDGASGQRPD